MQQAPIEATTEVDPSALPTAGNITLEQIEALSERLTSLISQVKGRAFKPSGLKKPPVFTQVQLAKLCHTSPDTLARRLAKAHELGLPPGTPVAPRSAKPIEPDSQAEAGADTSRGRKQWTLAEARQWVRAFKVPYERPKGMPGCVITTALFKGGTSKTFTTMSLAQGLSLMGYSVLAIDVDPQGSLTSLFGILPTEVTDGMTILPLLATPRRASNPAGDAEDGSDDTDADDLPRDTIHQSIRQTYWDGLDLIAGSRNLFSGEFYLPSRQLRDPRFKFWDVLNRGLDDGTRQKYDFIIIDTPPALSYVTLNTLWAADAVLMPLPPEGLDLASSSQYWTMFSEFAQSIPDAREKRFQFISVLPSKVDHSKGHTKTLLQWMRMGYGEMLMSTEIPVTQVVSVSGSEFSTVYDVTKYVGAAKTYARARDAYDRVVGEIEHLARQTCWHVAPSADEGASS